MPCGASRDALPAVREWTPTEPHHPRLLDRVRTAIRLWLIIALLLTPLIADAQRSGTVPSIGLLGVPPPGDATYRALVQGLEELGYTEGRDVVIEFRWGDPSQLPKLARELVRLKVDVIATFGTPAAQAAKQVTTAVPIVMALIGDPVRTGIVTSLARPGGNITGVTNLGPGTAQKRLELLREAIPNASRVALLWNSANPDQLAYLHEGEAAARSLGMTILSVPVRRGEDLENALTAMIRERPSALLVTGDTVLQSHIRQVVAFAENRRLPVIVQVRENVEAGALMSYAPNRLDGIRRAAVHIDKIFRGAKPGDLPVEQPTKFELVINLRTAKTLGLSIPPSLLLRADHVIE